MSKRTVLYIMLAGLFLIASAYQGRFIQRRLQALTNPDTFVLNQLQASISGEITFVGKTAEAAGAPQHDDMTLIVVRVV